MSFESLGLEPRLLHAVTKMGYREPTPIQAQAIPHVLAGRDVVGVAQTGTGKTAAFVLPLLQRTPTKRGVKALVIDTAVQKIDRSYIQPPEILRLPWRQGIRIDRADIGVSQQT